MEDYNAPIHWTTDQSVVATMTIDPQTALTFMPCNISINLKTGEVTIPEGLDLTDAAREFWRMVRRVGAPPGFV